MKDWLGNDLEVGSVVLYSSTSTLTGMNIGQITLLEYSKIQIKIWHQSKDTWSKGRTVTLHRGDSAYRTVTRYDSNVEDIVGPV